MIYEISYFRKVNICRSSFKYSIGSDFQVKVDYYENQNYYISWCIGYLSEVILPDEEINGTFTNYH